MTEAYLLLGSNQGIREETMRKALRLIEQRCGRLVKTSSLYETEAWGLKDQNGFLNQAISIQTGVSARELLIALKTIEKELGRVDTVKWGPRVINIDILFYGTEQINLPDLQVPHPYLHERRFTLAPLNEIAPGFIHPVLKKCIGQLLEECADHSTVNKVDIAS